MKKRVVSVAAALILVAAAGCRQAGPPPGRAPEEAVPDLPPRGTPSPAGGGAVSGTPGRTDAAPSRNAGSSRTGQKSEPRREETPPVKRSKPERKSEPRRKETPPAKRHKPERKSEPRREATPPAKRHKPERKNEPPREVIPPVKRSKPERKSEPRQGSSRPVKRSKPKQNKRSDGAPPREGGGIPPRGDGRKYEGRMPRGWGQKKEFVPPSAAVSDRQVWDLMTAALGKFAVGTVEFAPLGAPQSSLTKADRIYHAAGRCTQTDRSGAKSEYTFSCDFGCSGYEVFFLNVEFAPCGGK